MFGVFCVGFIISDDKVKFIQLRKAKADLRGIKLTMDGLRKLQLEGNNVDEILLEIVVPDRWS